MLDLSLCFFKKDVITLPLKLVLLLKKTKQATFNRLQQGRLQGRLEESFTCTFLK